MKKFLFSIALAMGFLFVSFVQSNAVMPQCGKLVYPHDPQNGYFNPDSVVVDTCLTKLFAKKDFQIIFKGDPFKVNSFARDTAIYRTWDDLDSSFINLKSNLRIVDSIFGNYKFLKVFPDITDSSRMASGDYFAYFDNYVEIDSVCKYLKLDPYVVHVSYVYRNNRNLGLLTPDDPGFQYGELVSPVSNSIIKDLNCDGHNSNWYYNPSLGWHIPSLKLPMAWEITKGTKGIKYLVVDDILSTSYTNPNYNRTTFILYPKCFKEYGHGLRHYQYDGSITDNLYGKYNESTGDLVYYSNDNSKFFGNNDGINGNIYLPITNDGKNDISEIGDGLVQFAQLPDNSVQNIDHGYNIASIAVSKHNHKGIAGIAPNCLLLLCCKSDFSNLGRHLGLVDGKYSGVDVDGSFNYVHTPPDVITESAENSYLLHPDDILCDIMKNGSLLVTANSAGDNSKASIDLYDPNHNSINDVKRNAMMSIIKNDYKQLYFLDGDPATIPGGLLAYHMYLPGTLKPFNNQSPVSWDPRMNPSNPTGGHFNASSNYYDLTEDRVQKPYLSPVGKFFIPSSGDLQISNCKTQMLTKSGIEYIIQRPTLSIHLSPDVIMPRWDIIACEPTDKVYKLKSGLGSYTIPLMGGILALMRSVDKYLGEFIDEADFNSSTDDERRLDITRKAYNIVTFTTYKVKNENMGYPSGTKYRRSNLEAYLFHKINNFNEPHPELVPILGDPLDRWYSNVTAFGKVNAFRCVMHSISAKADYDYYPAKYQIPQSNISIDETSKFTTHFLTSPDSKHVIHFGSLIKEGNWVNDYHYNCWWDEESTPKYDILKIVKDPDININGISGEKLNVLEWGGRHFPGNSTEPWKNNWGETILKDGITITVPSDYVACIDGILRQPNESYETQNLILTKNMFRTTGTGKILITGYLRDIELNGTIKSDDLEINTTNGNTTNPGMFTVVNHSGSDNSEIYGKVNIYNNSIIGFGSGTNNVLVLQPGGEINFIKKYNGNLTNNLLIPSGATLELAYSSAIRKIEPDPSITGTFDCMISVQPGGTLKVKAGAAVTLDIPIEVEDGGTIIFEDHTLAWIDKITLKKGGKIISEDNGTELTKEVILIPAQDKSGRIILEAEATLTINNAINGLLPPKPIALVGGVYLKSSPWCVNNTRITIPSNFTKFEVMSNSKIDLGKFKSDGYTTIKFNSGSEINLLAFNEIGSQIVFDQGQVTEEIHGEFVVNGATVKGFDALERKYNCNASPAPYVLAQIVNQHNTSDFKLPEFVPPPLFCPIPPLYLNRISLTNSTFQNVTFKFINAIKESIDNCNFTVDGNKIFANLNKLGPLPNSILDVILQPSNPFDFFSLWNVSPAMIPDRVKLLDLNVTNSSFKDNASMVMEWLTWDKKSIPNSQDPEYNYYTTYFSEFGKRLNGITVSNLNNVEITGSYAGPVNPNDYFSNLNNQLNYHFVGLNSAIATVNCSRVSISNRKFLNCRIGQDDQNSSVKLCKNFSFRVNSLNSLNRSKRWATFDNDLRQSNKTINLLGVLSGQDYRGNSINDFFNGFNIENGTAFLKNQSSIFFGVSQMRVLGRDYLEIPTTSRPDLNDYTLDVLKYANPFTASNIISSLNKFSVPDRSDIYLIGQNANIEIKNGYNNLSEFTNNHIVYRPEATDPPTKTFDLSNNNWKPNGIIRQVNVNPNGSNFTNQEAIIQGCDDLIVTGEGNTPVLCSYFARPNTGSWANLSSSDTVLENDFAAYLNDFCNGILSCECYKQRLFDLMQLAVLCNNSASKLQMIISCDSAKMQDPAYNYLNCDPANLRFLIAEAYERLGKNQLALDAYYYVLTNSHNQADTTIARWRIMNLEAISADTTFGVLFDSLMSSYYQRVDRDVTSTSHGAPPPPPLPRMVIDDGSEAQSPGDQNATSGNQQDESVLAVLEQNAPNPFTNETVIVFRLNREADVRLGVHDALGHTIKEVVNQRLRKGKYVYTFLNDNMTTGVYLYLLTTDGKQIMKKMQLVK